MVPVSSISIRGEEEYQSEKRRKHFNQASDPKGVHKKKSMAHDLKSIFFAVLECQEADRKHPQD